MPITREFEIPKVLDESLGLSEEVRELRKLRMREKNKRRFSKKNINQFVLNSLNNSKSIIASTLPLENRRDLIRVIFVSLYGRDARSNYKIETLNDKVNVNGFTFSDFRIIRRDQDGNF